MRCHVTPWCNQKERLLWVEKGALSPPECRSFVKVEHSPSAPCTPASHHQPPAQQLNCPPPLPLAPSLFTETSRIKEFRNCPTQWTLLGLRNLTCLGHVILLTIPPLELFSLGCLGVRCPIPPSTGAADFQIPSLLIFLQFPLKG